MMAPESATTVMPLDPSIRGDLEDQGGNLAKFIE